jgi:hypothetical protein
MHGASVIHAVLDLSPDQGVHAHIRVVRVVKR